MRYHKNHISLYYVVISDSDCCIIFSYSIYEAFHDANDYRLTANRFNVTNIDIKNN